jgi:hypothetical protein
MKNNGFPRKAKKLMVGTTFKPALLINYSAGNGTIIPNGIKKPMPLARLRIKRHKT